MLKRLIESFSVFGLFVGLLFLCASLTPSLLPRIPEAQGVLGGLAFAVGYGTGKGLHFAWLWLGGPDFPLSRQLMVNWVLALISIALAIATFSRIATWQNSIRSLMDMPAVDTGYPWTVAGIAFAVALVLIFTFRCIIWLAHKIIGWLGRVLPRNLAIGSGVLLVAFLVFAVVDNFVVKKVLRLADEVFAEIDERTSEGVTLPTNGLASGGSNSAIDWNDVGKNGKDFLVTGPSQADIAAFTGRVALEPIRVFAGFGSGDDFEARAKVALEDLINFGGFDRSVLIVATPTGTGWLDPAAVEPVTYLHDGDIAIVSTQYTYVPSWLSIMVEPDRSRLAARALFDEVYNYWTKLPKDTRPKLYLFGLSLGALGSEASADLVTVFADPIDGALWSGPPFASTVWARITASRNEGSPAWLPEYRDGALVRFMNQDGIAVPAGGEWGRMRLLYLQHASDPMVFFSPRLAFRRPDWLGKIRGRDVAPYFDWYPIVTFLQVGFDVPMATSPPSGYGHTYDALEYIDGWLTVTDPPNWTADDTERLKVLYTDFVASPI
ncbi:hypothetical protein C1J03_14550 [Sulfitobacter sp. SK012]|uniref:alpha/beta hydrolase n=1 Tax=Sulfitobacter sp. SK012 TaxID=1389005 RepID=UPI000E0AB2C5|nr:alpha/beta-hydrolase family protein [Sulfitobacter sp. SK012]AXI47127.1 hypothetical protein C1J03_14550 [Sulfitobacter sp. SK012]